MQSLIDIAGSAILAGIIIVFVNQMNAKLGNAAFQTTLDVVSQEADLVLMSHRWRLCKGHR